MVHDLKVIKRTSAAAVGIGAARRPQSGQGIQMPERRVGDGAGLGWSRWCATTSRHDVDHADARRKEAKTQNSSQTNSLKINGILVRAQMIWDRTAINMPKTKLHESLLIISIVCLLLLAVYAYICRAGVQRSTEKNEHNKQNTQQPQQVLQQGGGQKTTNNTTRNTPL